VYLLAETTANPMARVPDHFTSSVVDSSGGTEATLFEDFHIEGIVTSHKTVAKIEPAEKPTEIHAVEADYHFELDINNGHFTSVVSKLPPESPELETSDGVADSITVAESSVSRSELTDGAEQAQQKLEDVVTSTGRISKPLKTFLTQAFPPVRTEDEIEAMKILEQEAKLENDSWNCLPLSVKTVRWWRPSVDHEVKGKVCCSLLS
jgi:hypothetical protein